MWYQLSGPGAAALVGEERIASVSVDRVGYSVQPYVPGRKWAARGRLWLVLEPRLTYWRPSAGTSETDTVQVQPASFTLTGSGGTRLRLSGSAIGLGRRPPPGGSPLTEEGTGTLIADVPASMRAATLVFRFSGSIRLPKGSVSWSAYSGSVGTMRLSLR